MSAKSNYFVQVNETIPVVVTQLVTRIFIPYVLFHTVLGHLIPKRCVLLRPIPCHFLSSICILTAVVLLVLHFMHHRRRRDIRLAHSPGTICSAVALTWHSSFGKTLMPYDNEAQFSRKLASLRFCLDPGTGAIVTHDSSIAEVGNRRS